jgi:carboxyl-terminal processing protease
MILKSFYFDLFKMFLVFPCLYLSSSKVIAKELQPSALMQQETKWLVQALQQAHFNKVSVKDLNPIDFTTSYLEKLDKQKLYFTQSDADTFKNKYSSTLITFLNQGNLFPGFEIYNFYKNKSINRLNWVVDFLKNDFSFESNKTYNVDREEQAWEETEKDLDTTWTKLIEFEILSEILSSLESNSTISKLDNDLRVTLTEDPKAK